MYTRRFSVNLLLFLVGLAAAIPTADPWRPRPGRGAYRRGAEAIAEPEAYHPRPGPAIYTPAKREAEPTAVSEPEPYYLRTGPARGKCEAEPKPTAKPKAKPELYHPRPRPAIYALAKREAEPEPTAEPEPWRPRPGRGAYKREPWRPWPGRGAYKRSPEAEPRGEVDPGRFKYTGTIMK